MTNLNITIVQTNLHWQNIQKNIEHFTEKINQIQNSDIIVLPEMFTTGFTMQPELYAENHQGATLQWMLKIAAQKQCIVTGSVSVKDEGRYYNRLYWAKPDGTFEWYDKRHLFSMGNEQLHYTAGNKKLIIEYKGWKICPLICYDLRFPVWSRNTKTKNYDLLIYVANWPEIRSYPWNQLLIARAIENQAYVVGVNRIGNDGNDVAHSGNSCIINPRGEVISTIKPNQDASETVSLSMQYLLDFKNVFPAINDSDDFQLI